MGTHKWMRMTKCIYYYKNSKGLNYKTGRLHKTKYAFNQCTIYRTKYGKYNYYYLFYNGKCHHIPSDKFKWTTWYKLFKKGARHYGITNAQMRSCPKGKSIKSGSSLLYSDKHKFYLKSWSTH